VVRVKGAAQALRRQGYDLYRADGFLVEKNQGGAMVANTIRSVRQGIKIIEVTASRGKVTRAEPISALYAQGRISHVGTWTQLEDQMCVFTPFGIVGGTTASIFTRIAKVSDRAHGR
jgi:phage terminase large subunit-like protein